MLNYGLLFTILFSSLQFSKCDYPFRDVSLPWYERVDDLVRRLDLHELMLQLAMGGAGSKGGPAPSIPRLGIGKYSWDTECLRGDAVAGEATAFPQSIGLAATFSPKLIHAIAEATAKEVRAKFNYFTKAGQYGDHKGLSCFSPVINIMRHPLWGRNQETYGEDPYMNGLFAANFVQGLQGTENRYITANAGCKHFDAYAGPENIPTSRLSFDAKVAERDWRLTFLPAFRACVKAGTYSLMCSYNSVNGIPACANHKLLTEVLRAEWGFQGYVVSDEGALEFIIFNHRYINNTLDTAIACVKAGCNLELSGNNPAVYMNIEKAVKQGKLSEALVRERVRPLFYTRMRLGEFDPPEMNPYSYYNMSLVQSPEHRALAVKAAIETFVLLKNNNLLPVKKQFDKIAIVGPMANNVNQLYGDYAADIDSRFVKTPYEGLKMMAATVNYAAGCPDNKCVNYTSSDITKAIQGTQLVVICVGTGQELESEGNDRSNMNLAGHQADLIADAVKAAGTDIPVLLLLFSAGPVNISFADRNPQVDAIIQCFFPAQATGEALFKVVTSPDYSPAGRLPYTWYDTADQIPSMTNYSMEGRTYRYFKGKPLYPFGYGLSYSKFQYLNMTLIPVIQAGDAQYLYGQVMNTGDVDSDEVVQCYISWVSTQEPMPQRQLVGFNRYYIQKAQSTEFKFHIKPEQLAVWTDSGWVVQPGEIQVYVGGQQPDQARSVGSNVLSASFKITGTKNLGKF